jgi:hypothetical protein
MKEKLRGLSHVLWMIDYQKLCFSATHLWPNGKTHKRSSNVVERGIKKDLKGIRTLWEGVMREALNRLGGRMSVQLCWPPIAWCCNKLVVVAVVVVETLLLFNYTEHTQEVKLG